MDILVSGVRISKHSAGVTSLTFRHISDGKGYSLSFICMLYVVSNSALQRERGGASVDKLSINVMLGSLH